MGFKVDLTDKTLDDLKDPNAVDPGYHRVTLEDTFEDEKGNQKFKLKIKGGKSDGAVLWYTLYAPENTKSPEKSQHLINVMSKRMGLLTKENEGKETEIDFVNAISAEMVACVQVEEYPEGSGIFNPKVNFYHLHALDSDDIPMEERKALGLPELEVHRKKVEANAAKAAAKAAKGAGGNGRGKKTSDAPPPNETAGAGATAVVDVTDL